VLATSLTLQTIALLISRDSSLKHSPAVRDIWSHTTSHARPLVAKMLRSLVCRRECALVRSIAGSDRLKPIAAAVPNGTGMNHTMSEKQRESQARIAGLSAPELGP
jgi:hypothetical protein